MLLLSWTIGRASFFFESRSSRAIDMCYARPFFERVMLRSVTRYSRVAGYSSPPKFEVKDGMVNYIDKRTC